MSTTDREAVGHFLRSDRVHRSGDSARRRKPDSPRGGRSQDAGDQALHRQLPRLRRSGRRSRHGRADHDQLQVPADGGLQRGRIAGGAPRRRGRVPAARSPGARRAAASSCAATTARGALVPAASPATDEDYAAEYLGPIISVKVVDSLDEAIDHINRYGSRHTDAIVTRDLDAARRFRPPVDSSAVMVNASTRFNDGGAIRPGGRNRHQHRQVPRPRAVRRQGADQLQVRRLRQPDKFASRPAGRPGCSRLDRSLAANRWRPWMAEELLSQAELETLFDLDGFWPGRARFLSGSAGRVPAPRRRSSRKVSPYDFRRPQRASGELLECAGCDARGSGPRLCRGAGGDVAQRSSTSTWRRWKS